MFENFSFDSFLGFGLNFPLKPRGRLCEGRGRTAECHLKMRWSIPHSLQSRVSRVWWCLPCTFSRIVCLLESQFLMDMYELGQGNSSAREQIVRGLEDVRRCTTEINAWLCSSKPDLPPHVSAHGKTLSVYTQNSSILTPLQKRLVRRRFTGHFGRKKHDEPCNLESSSYLCMYIYVHTMYV
jgi:hypothetical protein